MIDEPGSKSHEVSQIISHPDWKADNGRYDADISLVVLQENVDLSNPGKVQVICLPQPTAKVVGTGTVAGWGLSEISEATGKVFSMTPNKLKLPAVSRKRCVKADERFSIIVSERAFCAGFINQSKSAW